LVDTAIVNVIKQTSVASVPVMDSLIFRPVAGDSARRAVVPDTGGSGVVTQDFDTLVVKDAAGNAIPGVVVRFRSADPLVAGFARANSGTVTVVAAGKVLLTAEATVYGKSLTDSVLYVVGWPLVQIIKYGGRWQGVGSFGKQNQFDLPNRLQTVGNLVVGQGGAVIWQNQTFGLADDSMDVQFDDTVGIRGPTVSTSISGLIPLFPPFASPYPPDPNANIPAMGSVQGFEVIPGFFIYSVNANSSAIRYFTRTGTYHWRSIRRGVSGSVRVVSNDSIS
jgi:hypothetical protein